MNLITNTYGILLTLIMTSAVILYIVGCIELLLSIVSMT